MNFSDPVFRHKSVNWQILGIFYKCSGETYLLNRQEEFGSLELLLLLRSLNFRILVIEKRRVLSVNRFDSNIGAMYQRRRALIGGL